MERKNIIYLFRIIKKRIAIIILLIGFFSLARTFYLLFDTFLPDFSVFYYSTQDLLAFKNPYTNNHLFTQVNYLPVALLFLMPVSLFEFSVASKLWLIISILLFLATLVILHKIKPVSLNFLAIIFLASVLSFPFKFTLGMGQINILILFLIVLLIFSVHKKNNLLGSITLTLSILVKLFPLMLFLPFLIKSKYKIVLFSVTLIIVLLFLSVLILGKYLNLYYFNNILLPLLSKPAGEVYYNQSLSGFLSRIDFLNFYTMQSTRLLLFIVSIAVIFRKKYDLILSLCLFLVLVLLINNFSWQHHLILLLIPYYFILSLNRKNKLNLFFIFISYLLVAANIKNPELLEKFWYGNIVLSHGFFGMLTLWLLYIFNSKKLY